MTWQDFLFLVAVIAVGGLPSFLAAKFLPRTWAIVVAAIWLGLSLALLSWRGVGPHGYGMFFFFPFWLGWLAATATIFTRKRQDSELK